MNIASISNLSDLNSLSSSNVNKLNSTNKNRSFEDLFQSAISMVKDTNNLTNIAEEEEVKYALGYSDSTHALSAAQQKANLSLQYTVAVRNKVLDAYKEIMNLQF